MILHTLSRVDTLLAFELWREGHDTHTIAGKLRVTEAAVYNSLWHFRNRGWGDVKPYGETDRKRLEKTPEIQSV
jgi:hypothetical protein